MPIRRLLILSVLMLAGITPTFSQRGELTISLNEAFFDALLGSYFSNFEPPEFSVATIDKGKKLPSTALFVPRPQCRETVKILREMAGVRTAVRFREGKIFVPMAFSGSYSPPFIGCVSFAGWAESVLELEFDQAGQRLVGRARVMNVNLNGTGGIGGTIAARMLQTAVDKRLNPLEVLRLDKISFSIPVPNSNSGLRMKAIAVRPEIVNSQLTLAIAYQFLKD